jgi:predicted AAA+ superfamily ATPase
MLLTGLRGVGKTVLLNEIERIARNEGYHTIPIEAIDSRHHRRAVDGRSFGAI